MRDILISSSVCVACLLLALISQLVSPTPVAAAGGSPAASTTAVAVASAAAAALSPERGAFELDPEDPNPTLFTMAPDGTAAGTSPEQAAGTSPQLAQASALGGELVAPKERVSESGLRVTDLVVGDGPEATSGQTVVVNYRGTLENGREFDSSYGRGPFSFPLGAGRVIRGWDEGVAGMQVGGKRKLVIPPDLAYGQRGAGGVIPANATLIFEVELLEIRS
ncbi:MAG: FKBP-type peptidyl-prolyl cis-trans isomerase [Cyanobacteria bacterium J06638_7]